MFHPTTAIRPLPKEVADQIKSSTTISSLHQVICGLLENALEAQADLIDISVDFQLGSCMVEDNGLGIPPNEFEATGGLCKPYHTSKLDSSFAANPKAGTFLASLASLSTLTITSHHRAYKSHSTLITHQSSPAARLVPAPAHHALTYRPHGTKVTVRDLFGALPVRVKHRALSRELSSVRQKDWHTLRRTVTGVLLAWNSPISLTVRTLGDTQKCHFGKALRLAGKNSLSTRGPGMCSFKLDFLFGILLQGGQCEVDCLNTWSRVSARTSDIIVRAVVSKQPAPSKHCQFISLGNRFVENDSGFNVLYDEINRIFTSSSFGIDEELTLEETEQLRNRKKLRFENKGYTHKELKGRGKGTDRWPMFYVRIESRRSVRSPMFQTNDGSPEGGKALQSIIEILCSLMTSFLMENHYRVHGRRSCPKESNTQQPEPKPDPKCNHKADVKKRTAPRESTSSGTHTVLRQENEQQGSLTSSDVDKKRTWIPQNKSDLGLTIALPKPPMRSDLSIHDGIGGWSRIRAARPIDCSIAPKFAQGGEIRELEPKVSREVGGLELLPAEAIPSNTLTTRVDAMPRSEPSTAKPIYQDSHPNGSPDNSLHDSNSGSNAQASSTTDANQERDDPLRWTNPVTNAQVMINSRTGLLLVDHHMATPASATISQHCWPAKKKRKLLHTNAQPLGLPAAGTWAHRLIGSWENPTFNRNEENIRQISISTFSEENGHILSGRHTKCSHHEIEKAFSESSAAFNAKISGHDLHSATILGQLDKKFILIKAATTSPTKIDASAAPESHMLVLVDQHAADERHGIEALLDGLCSRPRTPGSELQTPAGLKSAIDTTKLAKPILISVTVREGELFELHATHFADWGILLDVLLQEAKTPTSPSEGAAPKVQIYSLPPSIAERCRSDVKHLTGLLRDEIWRLEEQGPRAVAPAKSTDGDAEPETWLHRIRRCPPGILNMLNSRACRSAIMFNDELTLEECEMLIRRLATCHFPFQCAHGRPTMIPLVDIGAAEEEEGEDAGVRVGRSVLAFDRVEESGVGFADAWKAWRARETEVDVEDT